MKNSDETEVVKSLIKKNEKYEELIRLERVKIPSEMFDWLKSKTSRIIEDEEKKIHWAYEGRIYPKESREYSLVKKVIENSHLYALMQVYQENPQKFEESLKKGKKS